MKTVKHTPTPWHSTHIYHGEEVIHALNDEQYPPKVGSIGSQADAELIVTACNSYKLLVDACKLAGIAIRNGNAELAARTLQEAIAKAEGK